MRLSTAKDRDDARGIATIQAALDAGVRLLDTADAYCHDDSEFGHNERLIAQALATWNGDRSSVEVATKGGLTRPGGAWVPNGKAKHLLAACEASLVRLQVPLIDLYQLHTVDPKTSFETSVRALATLKSRGLVRHVGLSNVTVAQIRLARELVDVHSVQVSLSLLDDENLRNGVAGYCLAHGIRLIAYRPLGGDRLKHLGRSVVLAEVAGRHESTPPEVALAWLQSFGPGVIPIPGATRVETAQSLARASAITLHAPDLTALDDMGRGRLLRVPMAQRRPAPGADGDVVLVMGMPGAGKSAIAHTLEAQGYRRLNRDTEGGSLSDLLPALDAGLAAGDGRWVLDNTYPSRASRSDVIECGWRQQVPVRCVWVQTSLAEAQVNAVCRLIEACGHLPMPEEIRTRGRSDPRFLGPDALFRYERLLEPPDLDEGFERIEIVPFERRPSPDSGRALVMDLDVLCASVSGAPVPLIADDAVLREGWREFVSDAVVKGWQPMVMAWRPQVTQGKVSEAGTRALADRVAQLLEVPCSVSWCPHDAGPPICWCRRPLPGLILEFVRGRAINLRASICIGSSAADRTLAERLGMRFITLEAALRLNL